MKTLISLSLATVAVLSTFACTTVETRPGPPVLSPVKTTTTTTERSTVQHPGVGTTETKTTRSY